MNVCEQPDLSLTCNSSNDCIENVDWRPIQEALLTRFIEVEYPETFRTVNQDYGSFYYRQPASSCIPDTIKEKTYKRQERFMHWLATQTSNRHSRNEYKTSLSPQCNTETLTVKYRKKLSTYHIDEMIMDWLLKQIQQRLKDYIHPNDYADVFNCARVLITELLCKEPSLCAEDVINRVIEIMNTPFHSVPSHPNVNDKNNLLFTMQNSPMTSLNECCPITPPSSSFFPFHKY